MLTPKFRLSQDSDNLYLWMHVPYMKQEDAECEISDNVLFFSASPYFLRLHLPGEVLLDTGPSKYDIDKGDLTITLKKKEPGESFEGLDMLTWLLTPRKAKTNPSIEVIGNVNSEECVSTKSNLPDHQDSQQTDLSVNCKETEDCSFISDDTTPATDDETEWFLDQKVNDLTEEIESTINKTGCGFALQKFNFNDISSEAANLIDVRNPNSLSLFERRRLRNENESHKFNAEHYLADFFEDDMIKELLVCNYPDLTGTDENPCTLDEKELEKLKNLPRKEYLIEKDILPQLYLGLVDLIFAYAYNYRFSLGDENVEADWTICKLSSTLSWCDSFSEVKDVLIACARRCLCFPLYRHWSFFEIVLDDVKCIFRHGKTQILKCLLGILFILQKSEDRHVLNDLYIIDYCVWIQSASTEQLEKMTSKLCAVTISKSDVGLNLLELEEAAKQIMEESDEEDEVGNLIDRLKNVVKVSNADDGDSDDDGSSSCNNSDGSSSCSDSSSETESDNEDSQSIVINADNKCKDDDIDNDCCKN